MTSGEKEYVKLHPSAPDAQKKAHSVVLQNGPLIFFFKDFYPVRNNNPLLCSGVRF
jgi:hypothetical protein